MILKKLDIKNKSIEYDYHVNIDNVKFTKNGQYNFIRFHESLSLMDIPDLLLKNKNIILVYEERDDNIFYTGIARRS